MPLTSARLGMLTLVKPDAFRITNGVCLHDAIHSVCREYITCEKANASNFNIRTAHPCSIKFMMTSSNGNIFCVTGPLCGEFTGHRRIPLTKASEGALMFSFIYA